MLAQKLQRKPNKTLLDLLPKRSTRSLVVASTRSGKSTLACNMLEWYHRLYEDDLVFIIDPKQRYFPKIDHEDDRLFPQGPLPKPHGRFLGVSVNGRLLINPKGYMFPGDNIFVVQDQTLVPEVLAKVFQNSDIRKPVMVFFDESFDIMQGVKADQNLRRIIQMGGERGIGTLIMNQRPRNIDKIMLSESEQLYIGHVRAKEDREYLAENVDIADAYILKKLLAPYDFWLIDQTDPERNYLFNLDHKKGLNS